MERGTWYIAQLSGLLASADNGDGLGKVVMEQEQEQEEL